MDTGPKKFPSELAQKVMLRFEKHGHRDRLKALAAREKRSLNKQILVLIEAGEASIPARRAEGAQA